MPPARTETQTEPPRSSAATIERQRHEGGLGNLREEDRLLLEANRGGDSRAAELLLHKHQRLASALAVSFFAPGATHEDILQEAMIGLYNAIHSYDVTCDIPFAPFASMCVRRHLSTMLKTATRQKHQPLNSAIPINGTGSSSHVAGRWGKHDLPDMSLRDPGELLIAAERVEAVKDILSKGLSDLEAGVVAHLVQGKSYEEIARLVGSHVKGVDNAIQRLRRKLRRDLQQQEPD